ncbi:S41 family peptidase, partial [Streptomyces sp. SM14]|uniref:S41 family peptidase n=1 Tax=Streptomyces sp. SM14 TaxID=1736045 RepID=UPI000CD4F5AE
MTSASAQGGAAGGYLHHPTIAGELVVFVCEDDLWTVPAEGGAARRLTAGTTPCAAPRLSPDGRLVAFTGKPEGAPEICVFSVADGGPVRPLTTQAATRCTPSGWHPDTGEVLYASTAGQPAAFGERIFAVHPDGGPPRLVEAGAAVTLAHGPDGAVLVGRSLTDPARRKRYRGGAAGELWVDPDGRGDFRRLRPDADNPADPCWAGGRVYFLSDHDGTGNLYSCLPDGSGLTRHTSHRGLYARGLTGDGRRLVYHRGARLRLFDPATGEDRPIEVELVPSGVQHERRLLTAADQLDAARLSPEGDRLAVAARGKAFTLAPWHGPVRRHGAADGVRYRLLRWLADGRRLVAVAGDEQPGERLALLPAAGGEEVARVPLEELGCVTALEAAPTGGLVAFATNRQQLWTVDTDASDPSPRLVDSGPHGRIDDLAWSPDGRWLAYAYPETLRTTAVRIAEAATGEVHRITVPVLRDSLPVFDPLGRYLYFVGQRDLVPEHDQVQFDIGFPFGARPYAVLLTADAPVPFTGVPVPPRESPGPDSDSGPDSEPGSGPDSDRGPDPDGTVRIDFAGIERRVVPLPMPQGRYAALAALPDAVLLLGVPLLPPHPDAQAAEPEGQVTLVDLATGETVENYLDPVDEIGTDPTGTTLLYRHNHRLRVVPAGAPRASLEDFDNHLAPPGRETGWVDLDRVTVHLRPAAEWRQMFREAWRLQREGFWRADMDGTDWHAVHDRYRPLLDRVATRAELSDLLWELHGELDTSHAYERGGDYGGPSGGDQGFLGVDWEATPGGPGRWRIARVLRGTPWDLTTGSPCDRPGVDIRPGDEIAAVDGRAVGPLGPGELLAGLAGQEVELTVRRPDAPPRRVVVRASGSEERTRYLDWVAEGRRLVEEMSGGRLAYLHVPDMYRTGYADFVRQFLAGVDSEGLVVDIRYNGGGQVSTMLLDRLSRRRAGAEHSRWSGQVPYPLEAPRGPMVALLNEQTGSDGEIFCHTFRQQGLGPLVGTRTWGGTVGTWPRHQLVDDTVTTQPEFCYHLSGVGAGLENRGVEPDVAVEIAPSGPVAGTDRQLEEAVRGLLVTLGQRSAPTVPATGTGPVVARVPAAPVPLSGAV